MYATLYIHSLNTDLFYLWTGIHTQNEYDEDGRLSRMSCLDTPFFPAGRGAFCARMCKNEGVYINCKFVC